MVTNVIFQQPVDNSGVEIIARPDGAGRSEGRHIEMAFFLSAIQVYPVRPVGRDKVTGVKTQMPLIDFVRIAGPENIPEILVGAADNVGILEIFQ